MNNGGTGRTIAKNAGFLMVSQISTWGLSLLLTIFLPRYLGVTSIGKLQLATSLWAIVAVFVTFGMDMLLTKETARKPERAGDLLGTSLVLRTVFHVIGFISIILYARLVNYHGETLAIIYILGISTLTGQYGGAITAVFQGLERMQYQSLAEITSRAFSTLISIALLLMGQGVIVIASVSILTSLINLSIQGYYFRRLGQFRPSFSLTNAKWMLQASTPYLLVGAILVIYMQVDIVFISLLVNEDGVGWYGAADRLFGTFLFVPTVFLTAVFPALSRMFAEKSDSLPKLMGKSFDFLFIISIPIGMGLIAIANPLVFLLFGPEFAKSGPILAVIGIVLILTYQNMLLGQLLISTDRQNAWTVVMTVATVATIPLDFIFIPFCETHFGNGAMGGAWSFVVTELGMTIAGLRLLPKGALNRHNAWLAAKVVLAGLIMLGSVWGVRNTFIAIPVLVGAVVYAGSIWVLRVIPKEDWQIFKTFGQEIVARLRKQQPKPSGIGG